MTTTRKRRKFLIPNLFAVFLGVVAWILFYRDLRKSGGLFDQITELTGLGHFRPLEAVLPDSFLTTLYQLITLIVLGLILFLVTRNTTAHLWAYFFYHCRVLIVLFPSKHNDGLFYLLSGFLPSLVVLVGLTLALNGLKKKNLLLGVTGLLSMAAVFLGCFKLVNFIY